MKINKVVPFLTIVAGIVLLLVSRQSSTLLPSSFVSKKVSPKSAWDWQILEEKDHSYEAEFTVLRQEKVTHVYLSLNDMVDIAEIEDEKRRQVEMDSFTQKIENYILQAKSQGIKIEGLFGGSSWAFSSHRYLTTKAIDTVTAYNTRYPDAAISGLHFDIEPFTLPEFTKDPRAGMVEYLTTAEEILAYADRKVPGLSIGFDIPAWLDGSREDMPDVEWKKKTGPFAFHLLDLLAQYEHGYVVVMAYRNYAQGEDSTIELAKDEIAYASSLATTPAVFIGQELNDEKPAKITFFSISNDKMFEAFRNIDEAFVKSPSYKGIAVHEVKSFVQRLRL